MKKRSDLAVMLRLVGLVKPLMGFMALAIAMGVAGFLCAQFIPIFGGFAIGKALGGIGLPALGVLFACMGVFALARGVLRYAEQACNHYIAFKLLALIRDKVFGALRRLAPAKLDGRDKGDLIAVITSDIELLEVFYAHTISPAAIALLFSAVLCVFIGSFHPALGLLALAAYVTVGVLVPLFVSKASGDDGMKFRAGAGALSSFVSESQILIADPSVHIPRLDPGPSIRLFHNISGVSLEHLADHLGFRTGRCPHTDRILHLRHHTSGPFVFRHKAFHILGSQLANQIAQRILSFISQGGKSGQTKPHTQEHTAKYSFFTHLIFPPLFHRRHWG